VRYRTHAAVAALVLAGVMWIHASQRDRSADAPVPAQWVATTMQAPALHAVPARPVNAAVPEMRTTDDWRARVIAVAAMVDEPDADAALTGLALSDPAEAVREAALEVLADRGATMLVPTAAQALYDPSDRVRTAALRALARIGGTEAESALSMVLDVPDVALRREAVEAIGTMGPAAVQRKMPMLLVDSDGGVREAAAEWLAEYPASESQR
jgi:HEAT repeat protein